MMRVSTWNLEVHSGWKAIDKSLMGGMIAMASPAPWSSKAMNMPHMMVHPLFSFLNTFSAPRQLFLAAPLLEDGSRNRAAWVKNLNKHGVSNS
jgi:hypothetical protein